MDAMTRFLKRLGRFVVPKRAGHEHFIDDGRVFCPVRRRDVELDLCLACEKLAAVEVDASPPSVRCRLP